MSSNRYISQGERSQIADLLREAADVIEFEGEYALGFMKITSLPGIITIVSDMQVKLTVKPDVLN